MGKWGVKQLEGRDYATHFVTIATSLRFRLFSQTRPVLSEALLVPSRALD